MNLFSRFSPSVHTALNPEFEALKAACQAVVSGNLDVTAVDVSPDHPFSPIWELLEAYKEKARDCARYEEEITYVAEVLTRATDGDLESRVGAKDDPSEVFLKLRDQVNDFIDMSDAFMREAGAAMEFVRDDVFYRQVRRTGFGGAFRHHAGVINDALSAMHVRQKETSEITEKFAGNVKNVAASMTEMKSAVEMLANTAKESSVRCTEANHTVSGAEGAVKSVAAASEEMTSSINEISRRIAQSSADIQSAVKEAGNVGETMQRLVEASERVSSIIRLIEEISDKTNLLALNATIEAARAGETGRGFAVVASEVKALASQTGQATGGITEQVLSIQEATENAANSIKRITETIEGMNEGFGAVAAAMSQQDAATKEISANAQSASTMTSSLGKDISGVAEDALKTGSAAEQLRVSTDELSRDSDALLGELEVYLRR